MGAPSSVHILTVDDETIVIGVVTRMLRKAGYHVTAFTDPRDALAMIADEGVRVDLLVTDVRMPSLTGPELAERSRQHRPNLPILFVSAFTDFHDKPTPFGEPLLTKPFSMAVLLEAVALQLEKANV